ncbi:unnamed protein product [Peronospora farinosa]|uniref:Uncharacterized protein n=1 Tax=Peronospora farinosa TaxID=134698 RepID=A0AAV0TM63_9STRA|nr:unnamed protein product [Peronospora farinosa]
MQHAQPERRADGRNVAQAAFEESEFRRLIDCDSALERTPMKIVELFGMVLFGAGSFRRAEAQERVNQGAAEAQAVLQAQAQAEAQAQAAYQTRAHHQRAPPPTPYAVPGCLLGLFGHCVLAVLDSKLINEKFSEVEQYKGLRSEFCQ